ncbi:MAG: hypothetical protein KAG53_02690 [Endozoicomonadaceae bacterium]|nr:hypothetical protein [Endozoicomonadaceae bacterium]
MVSSVYVSSQMDDASEGLPRMEAGGNDRRIGLPSSRSILFIQCLYDGRCVAGRRSSEKY